MRVTEGTNYRNLLRDLANVQERMESAQMQISTGKRVTAPSDDPAAAVDIVRLTGEKSEAAQYERHLTFAKSKLNIADGVLDNVERMIERVRSLAQLSIGNPTSANSYTTEVSGIRDQIIAAANTVHAGRFIFGGSMTTEPPYVKAADSTVTYEGNSEEMSLQVSRTSTLQTQIPGNEIFNGAVDIFQTISDLVTAMNAGDKSNIDTQLRRLEQFSETVSTARSKIGSSLNIASSLESSLASARLAREADLTEAQAADLAKAITEFQMSQNALEATMAVGARISQLNLLDFL
ncbi:MAG: flagellar hook-associated protein FlgL [Acidobacteria bacterium]|nr:flagellar hook-associated protein FlgL [Acidobacteriota bacterium]